MDEWKQSFCVVFGTSNSTHQHISVFKIVSPVWPDLPLASNVPNIQFKTLRLDAFNVETLERTQYIKESWSDPYLPTKRGHPSLLYIYVCLLQRQVPLPGVHRNIFLHTCVGVIWLMSSDASCLSRVVFPPLSRPSSSILTSWSGVLFSLRRMDSNPCNQQWKKTTTVTFVRKTDCCSWLP